MPELWHHPTFIIFKNIEAIFLFHIFSEGNKLPSFTRRLESAHSQKLLGK